MAILMIRVEDVLSLPLNEFYDYAGRCYALSQSRFSQEEVCINLEDMYDAVPGETSVSEIPVIFVAEKEGGLSLLGWYKKAIVQTRRSRPTLFLEGNVIAPTEDAILLPQNLLYQEENTKNKETKTHLSDSFPELSRVLSILSSTSWPVASRYYEFIEIEDYRFGPISRMIRDYHGPNERISQTGNTSVSTGSTSHTRSVSIDKSAKKNYPRCISSCEQLAMALMNNQIQDIREILLLRAYAEEAVRFGAGKTDGYYYLAMADYQLGQVKDGLKAINKALSLEPDASDLAAVKAQLLFALGKYEESAGLFHKAYEADKEEEYLLEEGKVWLTAGQIDKGYACLKLMTDKKLLQESGIQMNDLENKWPFVKVRGFKWKEVLQKLQKNDR